MLTMIDQFSNPLLRDWAWRLVAMSPGVQPQWNSRRGASAEQDSAGGAQIWNIAFQSPFGVPLDPACPVSELDAWMKMGSGFAEVGPFRATADIPMAETVWQPRERMERWRRDRGAVLPLGVSLALPLDREERDGSWDDVILAYRRLYGCADWHVMDATDYLARPSTSEADPHVIETLFAALQEWNHFYVRKPLLLKIPLPLHDESRALLAVLRKRRLLNGVVLAPSWNDEYLKVSLVERYLPEIRELTRDVPVAAAEMAPDLESAMSLYRAGISLGIFSRRAAIHSTAEWKILHRVLSGSGR